MMLHLKFETKGLLSFSACLAAGILLAGSWLWPVTRPFWDLLDKTVFYALNQTLSTGESWQFFWAFANTRAFDLLSGIGVLAVLLHYLFSRETTERMPRLIMFSLFLCVMLLSKGAWELFYSSIGYGRLSPSLVFDDTVRLSSFVTDMKFKEVSPHSFPSDHGIVLVGLVLFFSIKRNLRYGLGTALIFIPMLLPRMVSGAHWLTDTLVGSTYIALISTGIWVCTPLERLAMTCVARMAEKCLGLPKKKKTD